MIQLHVITCELAKCLHTRHTFLHNVGLPLLCFGLAYCLTACAPKLVGPTAPSGYFFSMQTSTAIIWLGVNSYALAERFPPTAEVSVRVQDTHGQPVNGVPVTFEVEPQWVQYASVTPSQVTTRGGVARSVFEARLIGVVQVTARVDNTAIQTRIVIESFGGITGGSSATLSEPRPAATADL